MIASRRKIVAVAPILAILAVATGRGFAVSTETPPRKWNAEMAAHLLSRAGFGGTPEQVEFLVGLGREKAVDYLVDYERIPFNFGEPKMAEVEPPKNPREKFMDAEEDDRKLMQIQIRMLQELGIRELSNWWMERMVSSPRPLEEKMTLFWHGHFTSGVREVKRPRLMHRQNELLRRMAVGNFREMVVAVSRDPAMLIYLNNIQNRKQHPNENYARELMELFTLGVGHYTEKDVKEAARAFTGWTMEPREGEYHFAGRQHDFGEKTFLGKTGDFDGTDIIDIILEQPAAADFLVKKLWRFFTDQECSTDLTRGLAKVFRNGKYEIKPLLKAIFRADAFYDAKVMHNRVKGPVELIVGTLRALEVEPEDCTAFVSASRLMGQELLQPPNVKGWDGGLTWITTSTLFNRYNLLGYIVYGTPERSRRQARRVELGEMRLLEGDPEFAAMAAQMMDPSELLDNQAPFDPMPLVKKHKLDTAEKVVDHFVHRLLHREISTDRRQVLIDELRRSGGKLDPKDPGTPGAIRGVIHLIMSMPEYQLG